MLEGLPYRHFGLIASDCATNFRLRSKKGEGRSPERHYKTMSDDDLRRMDVGAHAADDSHLLYWETGPRLVVGRHIPIMRSWGFEPTAMWAVWIKPTLGAYGRFVRLNEKNIWKMGLGFTTRQNAEFVILGRRGNPKRLSKSVHQIITAPLREHSQKPDAFFLNAEQYGAGPYLELFGRQQREGWTVRGDESHKFSTGRAAVLKPR